MLLNSAGNSFAPFATCFREHQGSSKAESYDVLVAQFGLRKSSVTVNAISRRWESHGSRLTSGGAVGIVAALICRDCFSVSGRTWSRKMFHGLSSGQGAKPGGACVPSLGTGSDGSVLAIRLEAAGTRAFTTLEQVLAATTDYGSFSFVEVD